MTKTMFRVPISIVLMLIYAAVLIVLSVVPLDLRLLRAVLTVPFVLFIPGWALVSAFFSAATLDQAERLLLSLGLSIAAGVLGGFCLNLLPWGLQAIPWIIYYGLLIIVCLAVAARRGVGNPFAQLTQQGMLAREARFPLIVGTLLFTISLVVALMGVNQQPQAAFTQLWALAKDDNTVEVGVVNDEATPVTYRLDVVSGATTLYSWSSISLRPSERWQVQQVFDTPDTLNVRLYRVDQPTTVYREVQVKRVP